MGIFSEELQILDKNTAQLMVEEMQKELYKKYRTVNLANKLLNCRQELINYCNQQTYLLKQIVYFNKQADEIGAKITPLKEKEKELEKEYNRLIDESEISHTQISQ